MLAGEGGAGADEVGGCALEDVGRRRGRPRGRGRSSSRRAPYRLVVFDDDDRLAGVDEPVEEAEQLLDVSEVEAGRRLVEGVDAALFGHVGGHLSRWRSPPDSVGERLPRLM